MTPRSDTLRESFHGVVKVMRLVEIEKLNDQQEDLWYFEY